MSEDIYAKPDLSKKVRFQTENGNADKADVVIYDNYVAEESTTAKSEENTTEDPQQAVPVTESSERRTFFGVAVVFLGLLCLILLTAVIVLLVLLLQDKNSWNTERKQLIDERQELLTSIAAIKVSLSHTISQREKKEELQQQIDDHLQQGWVQFNHSFYYISSVGKTWDESREDCKKRGADLVIINTVEEQNFIARFTGSQWLGLTYDEDTKKWNWVDGTPLDKSYWNGIQPDGVDRGEHCVHIQFYSSGKKEWNDITCTAQYAWICEKKLAL
ncbi:CD209 antigen-like protein E isoform X1 [Stegastes partitus]|uniref:C-type lectin domain family 4 member F-like n=1 Tax=Stegastes partitus TaxID=144197 RepID=A0A3B5AHL4_9TELE|nr:PREDICTED: CD209 antigen-like protein E isoform X1 [Stegastes partitus]